jgi:hypothetical protein
LGRNTQAIWAVVVRLNCVVAVSVAARRLLPGAPVVSISTYVELPVCTIGVAEFDGVGRGVPLIDGVPLCVPEGVPEEDRVPDGVPDGVYDGVAVEEREDPAEAEGVTDGVGEGVGINTPCTYTEVPNAAPALATLSHIKVGKVATAAPQYTLFSERSPKLTPLFTGAGG